MSRFDALIPVVRSFLCQDIAAISLPQSIECKRKALIEQIDIISLGPTPCVPKANSSPVATAQRRPFESVVRLFSASRKRYSLPASICYPPQTQEVVEHSKCPKTSKSLRDSRSNQEYEVPRRTLSTLATENLSAGEVKLRNPTITRHSLSPQPAALVQAPHPIGQIPEIVSRGPTKHVVGGSDDTSLTLPRKCLNPQPRRFSAFFDPSWTLAGPLQHRHKPNKWTRLNLCLLTGGSRLVGYKSNHALNPNLVVFLCGANGIYAARDSGQEFVIKIAHPTQGTTVLAADSEEQALIWIRQINQYARGITPTESCSFLDNPPQSSLPVGNPSQACEPATSSKRILKAEDDSGFSAPVSSGSEGNSGDGVIRPEHTRLTSSVSTQVTPATQPNVSSGLCSPSRTSLHPNLPARDITARNTIPGVSRSGIRSEGLLSSMRRKMVSFGSKRRARKSLSKSVVSDTLANSAARVADIGSSVQTFSTYCNRSPVGFDWSLLDSADIVFSRAAASCPILQPTSAELQSNLLLASQHGFLFDVSQMTSTSYGPSASSVEERIIVCGEACVAVPGRLPWSTHWCILRPRRLDIFSQPSQPAVDSQPLFSLTLEPGHVELGLAGDKRHKAALRLAVPRQSTASLLFDAPDKLQMGAWIRGFIQALGIINSFDTSSYEFSGSQQCNSESTEYDEPEYTYTFDTGNKRSHCKSVATDLSSNLATLSLYDEVCSSQYTRSNMPAERPNRRWSSPPVNPWLVPPPSLRLLAQPLPPLPSMGPSRAESVAGTIDSSRASSNLNSDDVSREKPLSLGSEPELADRQDLSTVPLRASQTTCPDLRFEFNTDDSLKVTSTFEHFVNHQEEVLYVSRNESVNCIPLQQLECSSKLSETDPDIPFASSHDADSTFVPPQRISNGANPRRSVSCLQHTKPPLPKPYDVATLPFRNDCNNTLHAFMNGNQSSSQSSTTATSSGVALTAGSMSSLGSGATATTRPSSMAISSPFEESMNLVEPLTTDKTTNLQTPESNADHEHRQFEFDTLPTNKRVKSHAIKRADTVSGSVDGHRLPCELNYSPTNTSLVLVATQLEEVQHGAKRLRSRHNALSFRLTNLMSREHNNNNTTEDLKPVEDVSLVAPQPEGNITDDGEKTLAEATEEASESLQARLTAIEALIRQAETMEKRLRTEMNRYIKQDSGNAHNTTDPTCSNPAPKTQPQCASECNRSRGRGARGSGRSRRRRQGAHWNNTRGTPRHRGQSLMAASSCSQKSTSALVAPAI